jgi:hypothetical protein
MTWCCPKSVKACALRVTRLNASGVPLDPLLPQTRILTAGFVTVSLNPMFETGRREVIRDQANNILFVDDDFDVMTGMTVKMQLCGINPLALEMLTGATLASSSAVVLGDSRRFACQDPVMIELWSKNAGYRCPPGGIADQNGGAWIQWVLPRTNQWRIDGDVTFSDGATQISLTGMAVPSESWFPSAPNGLLGWPSYQPAVSPAGWPIGASPVELPEEWTADTWTEAEGAAIRNGGPLAWKCVPSLPAPVSECDWMPTPTQCQERPSVSQSFIGTPGDVPSPPWERMGFFELNSLLQLGPSGVVPGEDFQTGVVDNPNLGFNCECDGNALRTTIDGIVRVTESGFVTPSVVFEYDRNIGASGDSLINLAWDSVNSWQLRFTGIDWNVPLGITPQVQWQDTRSFGSAAVPADGDEYRLRVYQDSYYGTDSLWAVAYLNGVQIGQTLWYGTASIGQGYGWMMDEYVPSCYPTGAYGSAINTATSLYVTVTDNGVGGYSLTLDDPGQTAVLSDPAGPANNVGGAVTECQPNGTGAACASDSRSQAQRQSFVVVSDSTAWTFTSWPGYVTSGSGSPSGTGWSQTTNFNLSTTYLPTGGLNPSIGAAAIGEQLRDTFAQWVIDYGSGVPVEVKAASSTAVECLNNIFPVGTNTPGRSPTQVGVFVVPDALTEIPQSSVTAFETACAARPTGDFVGTTPVLVFPA